MSAAMPRARRSRDSVQAFVQNRLPLLLGIALLAWPALQLPELVGDTRDSWRERPPSRTERELRPVDSLALPREVALRADELIPRDATYVVALGSGANLTSAQQIGIPDLLHYWLLPRRWTADVAAAEWVIAVSDAGSTLPIEPGSSVEIAPGYAVAKVAR